MNNTSSQFQSAKRPLLTILFAGALLSMSACTTTEFLSSTSSTLDSVTPDVSLNQFVNVRIASIKKEAAAGKGENIDALAQLMGKKDKKAFSIWMQENYDVLFDGIEQPSELISRIQFTEIQSSI